MESTVAPAGMPAPRTCMPTAMPAVDDRPVIVLLLFPKLPVKLSAPSTVREYVEPPAAANVTAPAGVVNAPSVPKVTAPLPLVNVLNNVLFTTSNDVVASGRLINETVNVTFVEEKISDGPPLTTTETPAGSTRAIADCTSSKIALNGITAVAPVSGPPCN